MRKYTRWGESGKRPNGLSGEGPALREKTDVESLHLKTEWFWSLLPKLPFTDCFDSKWDWKKEKWTEVPWDPDSLTVSWQLEGKEWTEGQRTRSASLLPDAASRKENKELRELRQSITGSLAEASKRSFRLRAKGEGSNQWPSIVTGGSSLPTAAVSHVSNTFYTSQSGESDSASAGPAAHNSRNKAPQKQKATLRPRFVLHILLLQSRLQPSFYEATWETFSSSKLRLRDGLQGWYTGRVGG